MSYAVNNYNIAHTMLLKASEKYSGFLTGIENKTNSYIEDANNSFEKSTFSNFEKTEFSKEIKNFFSSILDRTTGMNFLSDIEKNARESFFDYSTQRIGVAQQYMNIVHMPNSYTSILVGSLGTLAAGKTIADGGISACDMDMISMKDVISYSGIEPQGKDKTRNIEISGILNTSDIPDRFS